MASEALARTPPRQAPSAIQWLRENLFNNWLNSLITIVVALLIGQLAVNVVSWALTTPGWASVTSNLKLFFVGSYPVDQLWRVEVGVWFIALLLGLSAGIWRGTAMMLALALGTLVVALMVVLPFLDPSGLDYDIPPLLFLLGTAVLLALGYPVGHRFDDSLRLPVVVLWLLSFPLLWYLFTGAGAVLPRVPTNLWGGFLVTMSLTVVGIVASFPLGVLLALGRRSELPVVKIFSTIYIEVVRGVPLITFFFMGQLMLPLFLPGEIRVDNLVRAMVAVTLFSAAYLAENVRGGLQSIPRGQIEAAHALGLNYVQTTLLITLPQALRAVIPALVGQFISLFKDTSLVSIVGLLDLIGIAAAVRAQPQWLGLPGGVWREVLFFVAVIYFIFSFAMSRVSLRIETNLGVGER
ncbi:MAG: amino acid ABC transporter permease [Chloroflexota bacterium]|nr:amino acid ABC transporter permease [Chloroflexota bacterium]